MVEAITLLAVSRTNPATVLRDRHFHQPSITILITISDIAEASAAATRAGIHSRSNRWGLVAGACNQPNYLVLPFKLELIRLVA